MTETKAKDIRVDSHLDLMLLRKINGSKKEKDIEIPVYNSHYIILLDAIELATNRRSRRPHMLQCIKCKQHFECTTAEKTKGALYYLYENNDCIERTVRYKIPKNRDLKYNHYYFAYAKDFMIYADFEAINKKLKGEFINPDEFNFTENHQITEHEIVAARYIVIVNDSKLNLRNDHPMFGKSFEFKGNDSSKVLQDFIQSLKDTCGILNKELDLNYKIDENQRYREKERLSKQTACFVCKNPFKDSKDRHLHHDHKQEKNNIIDYACARCNREMTEKRRSGVPVIFHNGAHYE